ncbi:MAG: ATP-dependent zinc metalloprotease FtsH [Gorillibacterium sp.]|nr:ATP-dependent zinc metalloprotease FtsH [Gorillibacterium sp.]
MNRILRSTGFYLLIILVIIGIVRFIGTQNQVETKKNFTDIRYELINIATQPDATKITKIKVQPDGLMYEISGEYADGKIFRTIAPKSDDVDTLLTTSVEASKNKLELNYEKQKQASFWLSFLTSVFPLIIIFVLFFFLMNQAQGGGGKVMNFGKSRARLYNEEKKRVTFEDVAGADEEKQELIEVVEFLKDQRKFALVGARIPKGVLLVGPPGTGKTLLARAVAGEAGVPFFSISGSDFVEMFVGVGASRVRDLFENAKKNAPCIIFIDEIDAVGRQRGAGLGGGHDEREQTLNQLLVEMDGFGANEGIIIVAATNRPDILDPALLRPGRFDRQITVDRPDIRGREEVLKVHSRNKPLAKDVRLDTLARYTTGFTGADLENLLNESALIAARRNRKDISMAEVEEAYDRIIVGTQKKSRVVSERDKKTVAFHEAGHAIIGYYERNAHMVHKVTIVPRGRAGGYVMMLPKDSDDPLVVTKTELLDQVTGLLAGRVSEELFIGEIGTGAYDDFRKATEIIRRMIVDYGMSDKLGPMQFGHSQGGQVFLGRDLGHEQNYSDAIAYEIDQEMQRMTRGCYDRARELLQKYEDKVRLVATTLLRRETLDKDQIVQLIETGLIEGETLVDSEDTIPPSGSGDELKVNIQSQNQDSDSNKLGKLGSDGSGSPISE